MEYKILIVEDELIVSEVYAHFLRKNGFNNVLQADTISEAKELVESSDIALFILDINVHEKDSGLGFAQYLRGNKYNQPILFSTGNSLVKTKELTKGISNMEVLIKPTDLQDLLLILKNRLKIA